MRTVHSVANSLLLLFGVAACDAKAGDGYEGEPLLTLRGSVSITGSAPVGRLAPALAFFNRQTSLIDIVDVEVAGMFPAAFTLDVLVPPPASADLTARPGQHEPLTVDSPPFAIGYITAVAAEHPAQIAFAADTLRAEWCEPNTPQGPTATSEESAAAWRGEIPATCFRYFRVGSATGAIVYRSLERCAARFAMCTLEELGNREFTDDPYGKFAGFSQNYVLVYLREAAPVGSAIAHALGAGERLAQGYHLFSARPFTWDEEQDNLLCEGYATYQALQEFNKAHGTNYGDSQQLYDAVLYEQPSADEETDPIARYDRKVVVLPLSAAGKALRERETRAKIELGCALTRSYLERIPIPEDIEVSVNIGSPPPEQPPEL